MDVRRSGGRALLLRTIRRQWGELCDFRAQLASIASALGAWDDGRDLAEIVRDVVGFLATAVREVDVLRTRIAQESQRANDNGNELTCIKYALGKHGDGGEFPDIVRDLVERLAAAERDLAIARRFTSDVCDSHISIHYDQCPVCAREAAERERDEARQDYLSLGADNAALAASLATLETAVREWRDAQDAYARLAFMTPNQFLDCIDTKAPDGSGRYAAAIRALRVLAHAAEGREP